MSHLAGFFAILLIAASACICYLLLQLHYYKSAHQANIDSTRFNTHRKQKFDAEISKWIDLGDEVNNHLRKYLEAHDREADARTRLKLGPKMPLRAKALKDKQTHRAGVITAVSELRKAIETYNA